MKPTQSWGRKAAIFLFSQNVSIFGSSIVSYAIMWYITLQTSSATMITISVLCTTIPNLLISPFAGVWADRYNRKVIIMVSDSFIAVTTLLLFFLILSGIESYVLIFAVTAVRSLGSGIQAPAVSAILPQIVPQEQLTRVNGISNALTNALLLISPAVGGVLLGSAGFVWALLADVVTATLGVGILSFLQVGAPVRETQPGSALQELALGYRYIRDHRFLAGVMLLFLSFFFLVAPAAFLTPVLVERSFGPEVWRLTANEILWTAGSLLGGVFIAVWGGFRSRLLTIITASCGMGLAFVGLGLFRSFWLYLCAMLAAGVFMPFINTAAVVLIQEHVEEQMMGRVFSIIQIISSAVMPLAMLVFGPLGDMVPIESILVGTGLCFVAMTPIVLRWRVNLRKKLGEDI